MYRIVSLFSGCGGLDHGFHQNGFSVEYACDNFPAAVKTFKKNISENCHLVDVTSDNFVADLNSIRKCDVVLGGFPCQGFSKAGPKKVSDSRNDLYLNMLHAVKVLQPKLFIAENVDGLSQNFGGSILDKIIQDFMKIDYLVEYKIIDMAWYGVPQHRRRVIFIGRKNKYLQFSWPQPTHETTIRNGEFIIDSFAQIKKNKKCVPMKEAISDLIELDTNIPDHKVTNNWPDEYNEIMKHISEGQKLCNVRFSPTSVYTWEIPQVFGKVSKKEVKILEAIAKNRRHKKYGSIPNGNPLPINVIKELSGFSSISKELNNLLKMGYLKNNNGTYDLKGAMFCSGIFKKPKWTDPSPTILTNFNNPRYFIHPKAERPFSLRECARLQTFPDEFVFEDCGISLEDGYKLVGNAVPPLVSNLLAKATRIYLDLDILPKNKVIKINETAITA